jgi:hypothetical protein
MDQHQSKKKKSLKKIYVHFDDGGISRYFRVYAILRYASQYANIDIKFSLLWSVLLPFQIDFEPKNRFSSSWSMQMCERDKHLRLLGSSFDSSRPELVYKVSIHFQNRQNISSYLVVWCLSWKDMYMLY